MLAWLTDPQIWGALVTLTALEIVLGIDNVIFISLVAERLPKAQQAKARAIGLSGALIMRLALLAAIAWVVGLTAPVFTLFGVAFSWRDLILFAGGLFLLVKATLEIHRSVEGEHEAGAGEGRASFAMVIAQIMLLDLIFSLDSIITAVGMTDHLPVMIVAVIIAVAVMFFAAGAVSAFIARHPTTKMLALSFLLLVGVALVADGLHFHIPRGYLYFAIAFSVLVEFLNLAAARRRRVRRGA
ncbi:MAG: TerC family protein [Rhodospirillales bacterium]|nr:MAG: TerC family protein [Rhodospirillales bacterium]